MPDDLKKIYDAVSSNLDIGDYDSFASKMQTPEQRKSFYEAVSNNGFDLGDYNAYEERLKKKDETSGVGSKTSSTTQSASQSEPQSGFRTSFEKGQETDRKGGEVDTFDMGTGQPVPEEVPEAISDEFVNAPWAELPHTEQQTFLNVEKHYKDKGWPSPYKKIDEFKNTQALLQSRLERGEITEDEYGQQVADQVEELGLNVKDGDVSVSKREMEMYNELVDRYYRQGIEARKEKEKDGFAKDVLDALNVGSARVLGLPTRVMALSENVSGKILNLMTLQDEGSPTYFQEKADLEREMVDSWGEANRRYDSNIAEALATGDFGTAAGQAILSAAETLPQLTTLIMGNAAGATNVALGYMGADKSIEKYLQNDKRSDMGEMTKIVNALGVGLSEVVYESLGTVSILNSTRRAIAKAGAENVRDVVLKSYTPFFQKQLAVLDKGMSAAAREGGSEMATQLTDNIMDRASGMDVNIGEGVIDAGIIGAIVGSGLASPQMINANKGMNEYTKRVRSAIPENMEFEQKVELIELIIKGDELDHQIRNGPAATRDQLKEELEGVKTQVQEMTKAPTPYPDLARAEDILDEPVDTSNKPVEDVSPPEKGKTPPVEEKAPETPKTEIEGVQQRAMEKEQGKLAMLDRLQKEGESNDVAEAYENLTEKTEALRETEQPEVVQDALNFLQKIKRDKELATMLEQKGFHDINTLKEESQGIITAKEESLTKLREDGLQEQTEAKAEEAPAKGEEVNQRPIAFEVESDYGPPQNPPPVEEGVEMEEPEPGDPVAKLKDRKVAREAEMKKRSTTIGQRLKTILDEHILDVNKKAKDKILKIGKAAPEAATRLVNRIITQKGATGQSKVDLERYSRLIFGDGLKTMSENQQAFLGEILSLKRTVEIENYLEKKADLDNELRQMLHEGDVTKEDAEALLEKIWAKDPAVMEMFGLKDYNVEGMQRALTEYYRAMQDQLKKQFDNGIINEALYNELTERYPYYSPRMVMKHLHDVDPNGEVSGIKPLEGGSVEAALVDPYTLLAHTIQRTNALISRNRTVKEAAVFAKAAPNTYIVNAPYSESFTEKLEAKEEGDPFIKPAFKEAPHNMEAIDYMDEGQLKQVWIDKDLWKYIQYESPGEQYAAAMTAASWLTGTPLLKLAATGANPEFAIKNLPIDALHAWMTTTIYSTFMPKAMMQLRSDYAKVAKDAWTKTGRFQEYAEEGGLMDFLTTQGKTPTKFGKHNKTTATVKIVGDSMAKLGEFSEVWTRLALRERYIDNAIKKLGREPTPEELKEIKRDGTAAARNYLDFSQGGNVSKVLDKFIPYLNAGVQVTRGSIRAAAKKGEWKDFALKLGQITGLATTLTAWNMGHGGGDDEEKNARRNAYLKDISPGIKARNFIIMTNFKYTDKGQNQRHLYFKIPKDALQSSITALAEDIYIKRTHDENIKIMDDKMFKAFQNEFRNLTDLGNLPPAYRAYVGSKSNYDEFYERELWTGLEMPKGSREEEYYPGVTPERFVRFGEITGRSPVRTQYVMKQFFTESNVYISMLGEIFDGFSAGMEENAQNLIDKEISEKVAGTPFIRRVLKSTYPQSVGEFEEMEQEYNVVKTGNNHALDKFLMETDDAINDDGFNKFLEGIAEEYGQYEAERLIDRAMRRWMQDGVSSSMIKLKWLSPEIRARAFHMLLQEFPNKQDQLWAEAEQLKINSKRFMTEVGRLTDAETTESE